MARHPRATVNLNIPFERMLSSNKRIMREHVRMEERGATLKQVFDSQFDQVKFDRNLCQRIIRYSQNYMTRNEDHAEFFGGVLLGVNPIRFLDSDRESWYEDVLDIDETLLIARFKDASAINFNFHVMSDVFNYTPAYIAHRLESENRVALQIRKEAMTHAFMVLHYRFLTSLLVTRFRYPADKAVAQATYAMLTGRYDIRRYGSWRALLEARSADLVSANSIYRSTIQQFAPDPMVIRVVTDTQGRIREVVKKIYAIHHRLSEENVRLASTSDTLINTDGEMVLKEHQNGYQAYLRYIHEVIPSKSSLIKKELIEVVASGMPTMPPQLLEQTLEYLSANFRKPRQKYLEETVTELLLYVFDHLHSHQTALRERSNLTELLSRLRALLMASRSSDASVLQLREQTERLVRSAVITRNQAVIASVRTGLLMYLVLRTMTKQHYSGQ